MMNQTVYKENGSSFIESNTHKVFLSESFNYVFNKGNGYTKIWGKSREDDPEAAPFNIILDLEITEKCSGIGTHYGPCKFCYKSNTPNSGYVTSFEEAKRIIDKLPRQCTQIAFGTDAKLESNPDWYEIFKYAKDSGFVPNVTVADITRETAKKLSSVCGAVAVSHYNDDDICYNSVRYLTEEGMLQVNIHKMISKETISSVYKLIEDVKNDDRLKDLNAIVFLSLKKKGRGKLFNSVTDDEFKGIIDTCFRNNVRFGFDSCSAHKFMDCIIGTDKDYLKVFCEPCESSLMSAYINSRGEFFPCSFAEGTYGWETGLDVLNCEDFIKDIWNNPKTVKFRNNLLLNGRNCPIYSI